METKEINCTVANNQLFDLGEPCACFTVKIPKEAKILSKQTDKEKVIVSAVCLQPSLGKIIASNSYILTVMDVECNGNWPEDIDDKPFECFIDPKAITALAGKEVGITVWQDESDRHYITCCEAMGVRAQYQLDGAKYVPWQRIMNRGFNESRRIRIANKEISALQKFIRELEGKTKKEKEHRVVCLQYTKDAPELIVRVAETKYNHEYADTAETIIAEQSFALEYNISHDFYYVFAATNFYSAIQADFNGSIWIDNTFLKFDGASRESLLISSNIAVDDIKPYFK